MSLLNTKVLPRLEGEYKATIKSYEEIENDKGGYVKIVLQLIDREYTYNLFPSSIDYVARNLRNQFEIEEEVTLGDLLEEGTKTPFSVWFSYNQDYQSMNVAFHDNTAVNEEAPDLE